MMRLLSIAIIAAAGLGATQASAQDALGAMTFDNSRFYAKAGVFFAKVDSTLRLDGTGGNIGTDLDLETDLGLPTSKALPFGLVGWRFSENWRAEFEYFSLARETTKTLDRTVTIGDTTYPVNASLRSGLSTDIFRLAVGYSFARGANYEIGGNLGVHMSNFGVFAEGNGSVGTSVGAFRSERKEQLVPLPTLGLYANYQINETLGLAARANYFQLRIADYKGQLTDVSVGATARINRSFGLGADFRYVDYRLTAYANDFTGRINYNFYGPFLYAFVNF
jgi:hypothetical protein